MARLGRAGHVRTGEHREPLVSQAHAEQRNASAGGGLDHPPGSAEVLLALGRAGARRDEDMGKLPGTDACGECVCCRVVAGHHER